MPTTEGEPDGPAVLAVDGGASKTDVALVTRSGTVLGRARGPASNHQMVGLEAAVDNLARSIDAALADAQLPELADREDHEPICPVGVYCLAGLDLPVDDERLGPAVRGRRWTDHSDLRNDAFAVLRAGAGSGWGVGVVCGTGLNCVAMGPDGSSVRFPALGELSGDFTPGGAWLGVRGLGLALRAADGRGVPTALRTTIPRHLDLPTPEAVLEAVYGGTVPFASLIDLAEVVLETADAGDPAAAEAVDQLADEVVAMVDAAVGRLGLSDSDLAIEVVTGGGIFEAPRFSRMVDDALHRLVPSAVLRPLAGRPPLLGAALLGLDALGAGSDAFETVRSSFA